MKNLGNLVNWALLIIGGIILGESLIGLSGPFDQNRFGLIVKETLLPFFIAVATLRAAHAVAMRYFETRQALHSDQGKRG